MLIHKMSYSSSDIRIERSIYFFYWLFKFAGCAIVKWCNLFILLKTNKLYNKTYNNTNKVKVSGNTIVTLT